MLFRTAAVQVIVNGHANTPADDQRVEIRHFSGGQLRSCISCGERSGEPGITFSRQQYGCRPGEMLTLRADGLSRTSGETVPGSRTQPDSESSLGVPAPTEPPVWFGVIPEAEAARIAAVRGESPQAHLLFAVLYSQAGFRTRAAQAFALIDECSLSLVFAQPAAELYLRDYKRGCVTWRGSSQNCRSSRSRCELPGRGC